MQQREKDTEVALGRHPKLYVAHALKSALQFTKARHQAYKPQKRQTSDISGAKRADNKPKRRAHKQRLISKTKLSTKKKRKINCHAP